jgi:hypothetical protein
LKYPDSNSGLHQREFLFDVTAVSSKKLITILSKTLSLDAIDSRPVPSRPVPSRPVPSFVIARVASCISILLGEQKLSSQDAFHPFLRGIIQLKFSVISSSIQTIVNKVPNNLLGLRLFCINCRCLIRNHVVINRDPRFLNLHVLILVNKNQFQDRNLLFSSVSCPINDASPDETARYCLFNAAASDSNNPDGTNSFSCCLERGAGVNQDIERAVLYYQKAASQLHPHGLYNFARCLEYGKGIGQDFIRAAKYYHLSAELNDADAQNSFGICLERGIEISSNLSLAAHYYQRSILQGHPDGANNLGFCLEHGRGVEQDIRLAAEYYKSAADRGHSEGGLNYRRCLRLLGRWDPPDRSSQVSVHPPSNDWLTNLFLDCLKEPEALGSASAELIASIE